MTISSTNREKTYQGNGVATVFPYDFRIIEEGYMYARIVEISTGDVTELVLNTDYTVDGVDNPAGGNVTYDGGTQTPGVPLSALFNITVYRLTPVTQLLDLFTQGPWDPESIEATLDKIVMICQDLQETLTRAVLAEIGSGETGDDLLLQMQAALAAAQAAASAADASAIAAAASAAAALVSENAADASAISAAADAAQTAADVLLTAADVIASAASAADALVSENAAAVSAAAALVSENAAAASAAVIPHPNTGVLDDTLVNQGDGTSEWAPTPGAAGVWGTITGTLSAQTDLQGELDAKADATAISNIDNTSDADKPVSTAQQTALDLKEDKADFDAIVVSAASGTLSIGKINNLTYATGSSAMPTLTDYERLKVVRSTALALSNITGGGRNFLKADGTTDTSIDVGDTATIFELVALPGGLIGGAQ